MPPPEPFSSLHVPQLREQIMTNSAHPTITNQFVKSRPNRASSVDKFSIRLGDRDTVKNLIRNPFSLENLLPLGLDKESGTNGPHGGGGRDNQNLLKTKSLDLNEPKFATVYILLCTMANFP